MLLLPGRSGVQHRVELLSVVWRILNHSTNFINAGNKKRRQISNQNAEFPLERNPVLVHCPQKSLPCLA
jgi:hypothetical protein